MSNMEPLPLIPEKKPSTCPEISHVLREQFQELLTHKSFPVSIARNLNTFNVTDKDLKYCATNVLQVCSETENALQDIRRAESYVMGTQARHIIKGETGDPLKITQVYDDLDKGVVRKYSLLQAHDLLIHPAERMLRSKIYTERINLHKICPNARKKWKQNHNFMPNCTRKLEQINVRLEYKKPVKQNCRKKVLEIEPKEIMFVEYEKDVDYQRKLRIKNISSHSQSFLVNRPTNLKFSLVITGKMNQLAPGMSCDITVHFKSADLTDEVEHLQIFTAHSHITVRMASYRHGPLLRIEDVCKYEDDMCIDFGLCYLSGYVQREMKLTNVGNEGEFYLMSEIDWYNMQTNLHDDLILDLNDFAVHPNYFKLNRNDSVVLKLIYCPSHEGFDTEKMFILCDNSTKYEIDLLGDCVVYRQNFFTIQLPLYPVMSSNGEPEVPKYVVNFGDVYPEEELQFAFVVQNNSECTLRYSWYKEQCNPQGDWLILQEKSFGVRPESGTFEPYAAVQFVVVICMKETAYSYLTNKLCLYVHDIPENALEEDTYFTYRDEYIDKDTKLLSILVDEIAVQVKFVPLPALVCPSSASFQSVKRERLITKQFRVFNYGDRRLSCVWNVHDLTVHFSPSSLNIPPRHLAEYLVDIVPDEFKDLDTLFILTINDCLAHKGLVLHLNVDKPKVSVTKTKHSFGHICQNIENTFNFFVCNDCGCDVIWFAMEHKYDVEKKSFEKLRMCNLNYILCSFSDGQKIKVKYRLKPEIPGRWFSIVSFYTIYNSVVTPSAFLAVVADVIEPHVQISLDIKMPLYLNVKQTLLLTMRNETCIEVLYTWKNEYQCDKLYIDFIVPKGIIGPFRTKCIEVNVTGTEKGTSKSELECTIANTVNVTVLECIVRGIEVVFSIPFNDTYVNVSWPREDLLEAQAEVKQKSSLLSMFDQVQVNEHVIEFLNVPYRTAVKKMVFVQNDTPITSQMCVQTRYFKPNERKSKNCIAELLEQMKWKDKDEWEDLMTNVGVVVVAQSISTLQSNALIDIIVYAQTWGVYLEELSIDVDGLETFYITLIIQVTCTPIEFPASTDLAPTVRFGSFSYNWQPDRRMLKMRNRSTVPFSVVWHVFVPNDCDECEPPFRVLYNLYEDGSTADMKFEFKLDTTGKEDMQDLFQLSSDVSHFEPNETKYLVITINPKKFKIRLKTIDVNAILAGYIYIKDQYKFCEDIFVRRADLLLNTAKVKLDAQIELPRLHFINGEANKSVPIYDILVNDSKEAVLRLVFKSENLSPFYVNLKASPPFYIESTEKNNSFTTLIQPSECIEVIVKCFVGLDLICKIGNNLYNNNTFEVDDVEILNNNKAAIERILQLTYNNVYYQTFPLRITLKFPLFYVSTNHLKFGKVLLNNTKKRVLKIYNEADTDLWFTTNILEHPEFHVLPEMSFVSPSAVGKTSFGLGVFFKPEHVEKYKCVLVIQSCLSQCKKEIILTGSGSMDEKYAVPSWTNLY